MYTNFAHTFALVREKTEKDRAIFSGTHVLNIFQIRNKESILGTRLAKQKNKNTQAK